MALSSQEPECPVEVQQPKGPNEKVGAKICPVAASVLRAQKGEVSIAENGADSDAAKKWRVSHKGIKTASLDQHFGELQRPMKCHVTSKTFLRFLAKSRQLAVMEMHGDLNRRIIPGGSLIGSRAEDEFG